MTYEQFFLLGVGRFYSANASANLDNCPTMHFNNNNNNNNNKLNIVFEKNSQFYVSEYRCCPTIDSLLYKLSIIHLS